MSDELRLPNRLRIAWALMSPRERAQIVRRAPFAPPDLRQLFELTEDGLSLILSGSDWQQSFYEPPKRFRNKARS